MKYKIYILTDPRDNSPRYVGCTQQSIRSRMKTHIRDARRGFSNERSKWIASLLIQGIKPNVEIVEETDNKGMENKWVEKLKSNGCNLTNGYGHTGKKHSEETRRLYSVQRTGKRASEETKQKMSISGKSRVFTPETKEKIKLGLIAAWKRRKEQGHDSLFDSF